MQNNGLLGYIYGFGAIMSTYFLGPGTPLNPKPSFGVQVVVEIQVVFWDT